ncbi:MAG TPA: ABC transporter permease [Stellaceae bacterium]|nr:ABC transporter permease [Stellaceae bacterium]
MTAYILRRLAESLVVLAVMSFVIYGLIGLMPGDPIDLMLSADPHLTTADVARLKSLMGVDQPLLKRYGVWAAAALTGDFGYSRLYVTPALTVLLPPLGRSALLMGVSFIATILLALPLGIIAALKPHSSRDHAINLAAFASVSMPSFWIGLMLILVFAARLGWLPAGGIADVGGGGVGDLARHLLLPAATLTLVGFGSFTRYMRAGLIEAMSQDYIRTARAKGASERRILVGHALRNALSAVVTLIALSFGALFSGALVTETLFAYPGMGKLIYDAILGNDFNLALAALLLATVMTLLANLAADLAYAAIDPRITYR